MFCDFLERGVLVFRETERIEKAVIVHIYKLTWIKCPKIIFQQATNEVFGFCLPTRTEMQYDIT
jgi:hypothetical protein